MDRIDLDQPRFTQAQVLQLVPALSAKDLQNWVQRGVLEVENPAPGRQGKRLYTGFGVIGLAFMAEVTSLGIGPKAAYTMADTLMEHAAHVHDVYPINESEDSLPWSVIGDMIHVYHRGYIFKYKGKHVILIKKDELGPMRPYMPEVYITVEVDFLVFWTLNRIYAFLAGMPLSERKYGPNELDEGLLAALHAAVAEAAEDA